ncbi:DNA-binding response regulator [Clostridium gelidum]|uniref:Stage 0 sporulation protein A homolog n=1 Tax=Clostridium gelidum TaxID=704125 RepID=A0ABM7T6I6_9CLOT|nr:LytTR family DNA-binding domain-containing protein [Clostridium gelidum]BCZ46577.1 DNA-binding response regulator [Clostridium gelidum]
MLKIAICEDDNIQRKSIVNMIETYLGAIDKRCKTFEFISGEELLLSIDNFDIYFLDIQMDNLSGIDTAKRIRLIHEKAIIIFTTGFKDYVFDAFDVNAFHYILKPIDENKFKDILYSAVKLISKKYKFLIAKTINSSAKILLKDIIYIESDQRKIRVHTTYDIIEYYYKISDLENELSEDNFFRCHKCYIINLEYVQSFDNTFIILKNFEKVYISRKRLSDFSKAFMYYLKNEEF